MNVKKGDKVEIWQSLYLMIWMAFLEFILIFMDSFGWAYLVEIHILLGVIMLALAYNNLVKVKKTDAPDRIKRIVKATAGFVIFQDILGMPLFLNSILNLSLPFTEILDFLHLAIALTIIAQASSVATAYDMWEEKEFMQVPKS